MDPVPIAFGRDADVFAIDARTVLRRYRDGSDATAEAKTMAYVAALGFPVPAVHSATGADLVMERLHCPTMLEALVAGSIDVDEGAALLADLHRRLHNLPARLSRDPSARVLHLDLHPGNVMLCARGPVVIDWRNATEGPAELDLAVSALILAEVVVGPDADMSVAAGAMLDAFLRHTGDGRLRMLDRAVAMRRRDSNLTAEELSRLSSAAALLDQGQER